MRTRIKTSKKGGVLVVIMPVATSDYKSTGRSFETTMMNKKGHSGRIVSAVNTEQQANYLMECLK